MGRTGRARPSRKRQTTLSFAPVSSLPPAGEEPSPARVRYQNLHSEKSSPKGENTAATSQTIPEEQSIFVSSDEDPIRPPSSIKSKTRKRTNSGINKSSSGESDEIVSPTKRRRTTVQVVIPQAPVTHDRVKMKHYSESDSDIIHSSPLRQRRAALKAGAKRGPIQKGGKPQQHEIDLEEDLEILRPSNVIESRTRGTPSISTAKAERQRQLELLKRRRAGDKSKTTDKNENSSNDNNPDSPDESEDNGDSEDTSSSEDSQMDVDSDAEPALPEDLDQYDADFVLEDDEGELGVPADEIEVPFEFTRHRYKRLKDHFRDVVEWMVHNKINPTFRRDDAVYEMAFRKVKDEVTGLAGSQFVSSVWNKGFIGSLKARPRIVVLPYPITEGHPCDACNRSKHPASYDIRFDGPPYSQETLESIVEDDSSDDQASDSMDRENVDCEGNMIPNENIHFYLGRHCKSKASMAHTLIHWRYHLNEWVVGYLERMGILDGSEILQREHWSQKKRTKYANEVVDAMVEAGEVDRLWRDFNLNLKTARSSTVGYSPFPCSPALLNMLTPV
ncbi:Transcription factor IIIc-like protein [Trichophyton interdigitale]|uniref:Transcription factor IIIc-like protein n=1 Tax=Trichophyton interdigitale TaxID=101480 RepID=A0A9P4YIW1_9EURO|nr:Transcription factor IIIc-like protein [Trichophyton interdigitale]KAF3896510.1 Transcription factor IIIc-like protein [Trichophyton interdigitale]KAG8209347.1 Transcription factor IIIc-like protein [Trichophyton interdigitale]